MNRLVGYLRRLSWRVARGVARYGFVETGMSVCVHSINSRDRGQMVGYLGLGLSLGKWPQPSLCHCKVLGWLWPCSGSSSRTVSTGAAGNGRTSGLGMATTSGSTGCHSPSSGSGTPVLTKKVIGPPCPSRHVADRLSPATIEQHPDSRYPRTGFRYSLRSTYVPPHAGAYSPGSAHAVPDGFPNFVLGSGQLRRWSG